ncbi:MAG TPA: hypothetical protein ENJ97_00780 [Planctomycetes bacterium]|nr:hypothetical protein [Planctomycetota bacterium]
MARDTIIYKCECCGAKFHINFVTRKVTLVERPGGKKVQGLEDLVELTEEESKKREEKFRHALEDSEKEKDRLNALFEEARKKAAREKNPERPPNPFDLD